VSPCQDAYCTVLGVPIGRGSGNIVTLETTAALFSVTVGIGGSVGPALVVVVSTDYYAPNSAGYYSGLIATGGSSLQLLAEWPTLGGAFVFCLAWGVWRYAKPHSIPPPAF
jgi:hypothetical protein